MTSHGQERNVGPEEQSTYSESAASRPSTELPANTLDRVSSIRFSEGTRAHSRNPMSSYRRTPSHSDEIIPIRTADGNSGRHYNTEDTASDPSSRSANSPVQEEEASKQENKPSWFKKLVQKYGSVSLENKGSVARDHLALERTFLAWLRTSLAFASIGIAITQLFRLNTTIASRPDQSTSSLSLTHEQMPLSPFVGQSIPAELLPYLQQLAASAALSTPTLGPTLLDQLLSLPPPDSNRHNFPKRDEIGASALDESTATKLRHVGKPLGATFLGISIIVLFIGFHRYFEAQHWIIRGKFPASRGSIFIVGFIAGSLIVTSFAVVLAIAPTSYEKKR
ncbi:hypothetical protein A1O3_10376 [Capronia epimyces CBS 606.96]|uniref:DUF202 domain-containing protein n=1 Tax=Capronia epimyces CBS 606.96 TaxID=1182542 RepID=W9XAE5_9EURO|nr:uncharacterized protein A1O3_10376 [Capronia epimyces CBS 606.96]EXJ77218.1 hypothetical protein A1O3_10376 [Capronia epimyces CBS 606.96]